MLQATQLTAVEMLKLLQRHFEWVASSSWRCLLQASGRVQRRRVRILRSTEN